MEQGASQPEGGKGSAGWMEQCSSWMGDMQEEEERFDRQGAYMSCRAMSMWGGRGSLFLARPLIPSIQRAVTTQWLRLSSSSWRLCPSL